MVGVTESAAENPLDDNLFETIDDVYWRATVGDIIAAHSDPQHPLRVLEPQRFTTVHRQVTALLTRVAATVGRFRLWDQVPVRPPGRQVAAPATVPDTSALDLVGQLRADIRNLHTPRDRSEMSRLMSQHSATIDVLARVIRAADADHALALKESETRRLQAQRREQAARRTVRYYAAASLILGVAVVIMWLL